MVLRPLEVPQQLNRKLLTFDFSRFCIFSILGIPMSNSRFFHFSSTRIGYLFFKTEQREYAQSTALRNYISNMVLLFVRWPVVVEKFHLKVEEICKKSKKSEIFWALFLGKCKFFVQNVKKMVRLFLEHEKELELDILGQCTREKMWQVKIKNFLLCFRAWKIKTCVFRMIFNENHEFSHSSTTSRL